MADLSLAPAAERSPLKAILIAIAVLAIVGAAIFWFNPHKVADASVTHVDLFAPHTEMGSLTPKNSARMPGGMRVIGKDNKPATGTEDNLYVAATVRLDNKLRLPVFITSATATLTDAHGNTTEGRVIAAHDIPRVEGLFPNLTPMLPHPVADGEEAAPGGTAQGQVLVLFPTLTADAWHAKKAATLTLGLAHQDPITVPIP